MKTKHLFFAGAATAILCLAIANLAAATSPPGFRFSRASVDETAYTFNSVPVSCEDSPAASDRYVWNVKLVGIDDDFVIDLANNVILVAFSTGSCKPIGNVTNTIEIPPGASLVHTSGDATVHVDFTGAVPDFNSNNASNDINLPFFDNIRFHLEYNSSVTRTEGLAKGTGLLQVSGNANLCDALLSGQPQCFILDLNYLDYLRNGKELACICATPSVEKFDLTSILSP